MKKFLSLPTRYKGFHFRSRLEARWAVFLDALRILWEYEREGFELPTGKYLPDFWLPGHSAWMEVKGAAPTTDERILCAELSKATEAAVLLVAGDPGADGYPHEAFFAESVRSVFFRFAGAVGRVCLITPEESPPICEGLPVFCEQMAAAFPSLDWAFAAARSARFEHRQRPRIPAPGEGEIGGAK